MSRVGHAPVAEFINGGRIFTQVKLGTDEDYGGRWCVVRYLWIPLILMSKAISELTPTTVT